jgi:hypothetical protein
MNLFRDFEEFILLLQKNGIQYLIVGGYAIGIHSQPKVTQDIDIWIKATADNAERILKVLEEFGAHDLNVTIKDIMNPDIVIQFGKPPFRIDIFSSIDGVDFDEAFREKFIHDFGNLKDVNFISLSHLIKNKKSSGREKDKFDIQWLKDYGKNS